MLQMMGLVTEKILSTVGSWKVENHFSLMYMPLDTGEYSQHTYAGYFFVAYAFALF
jgi:hypothetical protein